ncbi:hypothetical protein FB567DRAFT_585707 [Paraphoma chrysanthemicola]|uniref:Uncharacterized protein n=1 Tax=Paraphoma chrysanthemicola TaxID=798071 RepID=A0A8K0RFY8_9PLEO|nr:hypothetical protein FB567DRAFT_585707 [Paraphoma chrysanthemicola]
MAYQDYNDRYGAGWSHYGDYREGQEYPSYYDKQPREPQGYRSGQSSYSSASSEYISRPKYSKTDYITPKSRSSHRSGTDKQRYRSAYMNTNEDYIEPPLQDDREDYIAPRKKDTHRRRHTGYERQYEQGRWGEDVEMKRSRQADDREYPRRHDETRYYDNTSYNSRDAGISAQDQYTPSYTFSTNIPGSFPHEPEYSPPTKPIYTPKKTRFHNDPSRSRLPSVSSSSSYDSGSDIQSIPQTSQPKPRSTSTSKSNRTNRSKHPSTSKTSDHRSASPKLDSDADPERAYGSDFATLVDSSSESASSSSRNIRHSRQQRRRDSDITSLPNRSISPSHRQRYASPAFGRPRTSTTRKASRSARNEKVHGSDVESLHDESDVEWYGSDVAVIESNQRQTRSRNKQDGDGGSDICSLPDKTRDEWRGRRASDVESLRREGRGGMSDVESGSGSGSEGRWDCDDGVELSSDEE